VARVPAAERRQELIDAAVTVIAERGVDGATTRRIAEQAGAPLATLHYCFSSKELLFSAVFEHISGLYADVLNSYDVQGDIATDARGLLRAVLDWYVGDPDMTVAIFELISWAQRQDSAKAIMVFDSALATVRSILINAAASAGQAVDVTKLDELGYIVTVLSDGFAVQWATYGVAGRREIDLTVGALDAWVATHLDSDAEAAVPSSAVESAGPVPSGDGGTLTAPGRAGAFAGLVSWVGDTP
jgi:AcrR family transcriptional regulator